MLSRQEILDIFINTFADFIHPNLCIICNSATSSKNKICHKCWETVPIITKNHPLYYNIASKLIAEGHVNNLVTCYLFQKENPFQHIIHMLKYNEYKSIGLELGRRIGRLIQDSQIRIDFIVPVPIHKIKERERGYNQAEIIARGISAIINKPIEKNLIKRVRNTISQTKLNIEQRKANVTGAFKADSQKLQNKSGSHCLLVDDIITTGSTINACAKELNKYGITIIAASAGITDFHTKF